jgi:hypothetical protein
MRIGYAKFYSRSHHAVIRVCDAAGNVIQTHEHAGEFKEPGINGGMTRPGRFSDFGAVANVRRSGEIWRRSRKPPCRTNAYGRLSIYQ